MASSNAMARTAHTLTVCSSRVQSTITCVEASAEHMHIIHSRVFKTKAQTEVILSSALIRYRSDVLPPPLPLRDPSAMHNQPITVVCIDSRTPNGRAPATPRWAPTQPSCSGCRLLSTASLRMATAWSMSASVTVSGGTRRMTSPLPAVMAMRPRSRATWHTGAAACGRITSKLGAGSNVTCSRKSCDGDGA